MIRFGRLADGFSRVVGSRWTFFASAAAIAAWLGAGPCFAWSDGWHRAGDISMTVLTFLMVSLFQNSANRTARAAAAKQDELISAIPGARNELIRKEESDEGDIEQARL